MSTSRKRLPVRKPDDDATDRVVSLHSTAQSLDKADQADPVFSDQDLLHHPNDVDAEGVHRRLTALGFDAIDVAWTRFAGLCSDDIERGWLAECLPSLLHALAESPSPDSSLLNLERYVQSVPDRRTLFEYLSTHPRAVEILIRLSVGSQFLTDILIREPQYLERLARHRQLADVRHRGAFRREAAQAAESVSQLDAQLNEVRRFQKWELLRLGSCDLFGLMDLKTVTLQLSLLADSIVQVCLDLVSRQLEIDVSRFTVLALGKLGGEELNYSSDIDLVFLADRDAEDYWPAAQRLIKALSESTSCGFLYRVDMRLRPWGRSGPLVCTADAYLKYLREHSGLWEKQALLKARCIAGNEEVARSVLAGVRAIQCEVDPDLVPAAIREMKADIERKLDRSGRWGDVKTGHGGIRDVEFLVQGLQLIYGGRQQGILCTNTLESLVRLTDHGLLEADHYRRLRGGYAFLRTIEHSLQLMHNKQLHSLPTHHRELTFLARRLDFPTAEEFTTHYEQHCDAIRAVFDQHFPESAPVRSSCAMLPDLHVAAPYEFAVRRYNDAFDAATRARHAQMLDQLGGSKTAVLSSRLLADDRFELTVGGFDELGNLSVICGLLFVHGFNIDGGKVFTQSPATGPAPRSRAGRRSDRTTFINVFDLSAVGNLPDPTTWSRYEADLVRLLELLGQGRHREVHGRLAKRVARVLRPAREESDSLLPVEIEIDNDVSSDCTVLDIRARDTVGFLYELTNALSMSGISIRRMHIQSIGERVADTLHVTDRRGRKLTDDRRLLELRAAIVLTKHFTHLLPASPNPESALLNFRELLERLFAEPDWINELARLHNSDVLRALARLLGVSEFLWHDFLKLQHANLFPVITDLESLQQRRTKAELLTDVRAELAECPPQQQVTILNQFKDREMLRVDMRHILGLQRAFGLFAHELTDVAEVVVEAATDRALQMACERHGRPRFVSGEPSRLAVCALGKCGGRELGFASDIELMFVYEADGQTDGENPTSCLEFYERLVDLFRKSIDARREGIFQIDLRLRPYGSAGRLAVSLATFEHYFGPEGPAWPYERQALVKLRPIAGDAEFGRQVVAVRDRILYTREPFDTAAMRAMRERQLHQLVSAGTFNAKLSPGALVDCEYLVQALQMSYGAEYPQLRVSNTREALKALESASIITREQRLTLRDAYRFFRRVIDGLRMVRGDARDLTVPAVDSEEFEFLARRLGYSESRDMQHDLERFTTSVRRLGALLDADA